MAGRNDRILRTIASLTSEGESLVVQKNELIAMADLEVTHEELDRIMEALEVNDTIALKYTDANAYCLTLRPKGRLIADKVKQEEVAEAMAAVEEEPIIEQTSTPVLPPVPFNYKKLAFVCGISSFIGGFIAAMIAFIVTRFA